jgi:ATP-dependent Lon protease
VLPVGGTNDKVFAAHRSEVRRVILPKDNESDLRELPEQTRQEMEYIFSKPIGDVLAAADLAEWLQGAGVS